MAAARYSTEPRGGSAMAAHLATIFRFETRMAVGGGIWECGPGGGDGRDGWLSTAPPPSTWKRRPRCPPLSALGLALVQQ